MSEPSEAKGLILSHRSVLRISGPDRVAFLQGLVSNDIEAVSATRSIWSAFLTPQGKFLHEFFVVEEPTDPDGGAEPALLLDCETDRRSDLQRRLKLYKLRSQVQIEDAHDSYRVAALFGKDAIPRLGLDGNSGVSAAFQGGRVFVDPRLPELGVRAILPTATADSILDNAGFRTASLEDYDAQRSLLGVPDGSRDLEVEKSTLLENGFDELHGVDWDKGCYMGQELTARTKYRALIKKRLMPVEISGPVPEPGTALLFEGKDVGTMRSGTQGRGLATVRLDALKESQEVELQAGETRVTARKPDWMQIS